MRKKILITSAGLSTAISVILALKRSSLYECKIVATDMDKYSAGLYLADSYYITPSAKSEEFLSRIKYIIKKEDIDFIFPLHSSEIELFAKNKNLFKEMQVGINIPEQNIVSTCVNKDLFQSFLQKHGFNFPKTYKNSDEIERYPVFIKLKVGSSSKGTYKIFSKHELDFYLNGKNDQYIIQEYIDWNEITVDCYVNKNRKLVGFVPRYRIKVKDGKSIVAKTMHDENIFKQTQRLLEILSYTGACNIQMFYKNGDIKIIELNPRLSAGGLPLTIEAGVNIPELMLKDFFDKVGDNLMEYNKNLTMYRYLTEFFL